MSQEKLFKNFIAPVLIETTIIFVILTISLLLEFYSRDLLMVEIIRPVTGRAIQTALGFAFFYRLFRSGASNILWMLSIIIKPEQEKTMDKYDYLQDVFITLCIILTTTPVRPILQTARIDGSEVFFEQGFARFDSFESILILIAVSIPLLIHIFISKQGKERTIPVILIIIAISTVGFINSKPNYLARIYESRAGWVTDDQDKQRASGLQALEDAETDQEKAVAYYWLGVAENLSKNTQKAIEYQKLAIEHDPTYGPPHSSLSLAYLHSGNSQKPKSTRKSASI